MASHRSPDAPADDQAFSEAFDEDKSPTAAEQRRPDRTKADTEGAVQPVDEALDGDTGERFGETVQSEEPLRRREVAADQARSDGIPAGPKADRRRAPDDPDEAEDETLDEDEKIDEAMEETFPASDPPPVRPGES